jgi:Ca2+-binding EF-hand superfamily protein
MFSRSLIVAAAALAASAAISLPATAQPNGAPAPGPKAGPNGSPPPNKEIRGTVIFWLLDRNNDGQIDRSEVDALRAVIFDAVDTDGNGTVSQEEFIAVLGNFHGPRGMRGDRDDGPRHGRWQQRGDRGDGPRGRGYAEQGRGPGPHHGHWEGRGPGPGPGKGDFAERRGERMMDRLGIDEDGLTKNDFVTAAPKLFERADADNNGTVSQSEFEQASQNIGRLFILE